MSQSRTYRRVDLDFRQAAALNDRAALQAALDAGADIFAPDKHGRTALHAAAHAGSKDMVEQLLALKLPPDARDEMDDAALHIALQNGHVDVAKILLCAAPFMHQSQGQSRESPLHLAAAHSGTEDFMQECLNLGADINAKDIFGRTPLMQAVLHNHIAAVQFLVKANANGDIGDIHGFTAQKFAEEKGFSALVAYLRQAPKIQLDIAARRVAEKRQDSATPSQKKPLHI